MEYSTFNIDDIMGWRPCPAWDREAATEGLGEGWSGTVIDVLNSGTLANDGKLWVAIMCGDLSDETLEEFSEACKEHSSIPDNRYKETIGNNWRSVIGIDPTVAQEKAVAYCYFSTLFRIDNSENNPLPLSGEIFAAKESERIAKKEQECDWQVSKLLELLTE
jgi:hypothetical protein